MKLNQIKLFLLILAGAALISCVNEEYDLDKEIDGEITVLKNLTVPVGDLRMFKLNELLNFNEGSEILAIDDNGDYYLHFSGETFEESFMTDGFSLATSDFTTKPFKLSFPAFSLIPGYQFSYSDLTGSAFAAQQDITISSNLTSLVKDVKSVECDIRANVTFSITSGSIYIKPGFKLHFPSVMHLVKADPSDDHFVIENGNVVSVTKEFKVSHGHEFNLNLKLDQINFPQGSVNGGILTLNDEIAIEGDFYVKTDDFTSKPDKLEIGIIPSLNVVDIESVTAKIKIDEVVDGTTIEVPELPEFFSEADVCLDLYNPQLSLTVNNSLPMAFSIGTNIVAHLDNEDISINPFGTDLNTRLNVQAGTDNIYLISRRPVADAGTSQNIVNPKICDIIRTIPNSVGVEYVSVRSESDDYVTFNLDGEYKMAIGYEMNVPLSFDQDALVSFAYDIENLDIVFDGLVPSAQLCLDMVNSIPLDFKVNAECIDSEGNISNVMQLTVEGEILAGSHQSATTNSIRISLANKGDIFELHTLRLSLAAAASDEHVGISLNENQGLEIKNITMSIPDGVTIDFAGASEE